MPSAFCPRASMLCFMAMDFACNTGHLDHPVGQGRPAGSVVPGVFRGLRRTQRVLDYGQSRAIEILHGLTGGLDLTQLDLGPGAGLLALGRKGPD